jgi:hypothetical protein
MRFIFFSAGIASVFTLLLLFVSSYSFILVAVFLIGVFFSIGQLSFYVHFWNTTSSERRGRIGGLIGFATLPFYFIINAIAASNLSLFGTAIIATALCIAPVIAVLLRPRKTAVPFRTEGIYQEKRTILFYAIPWILFSLTNATLAKNITLGTVQSIAASDFTVLVILQTVGALVGALTGGIIADFFGRRLALALSVTLSGISMALSGLVQNPSLYYFVYVADGLSWGILLTMYSFVIWGDLSNKQNCAKMYAIGLVTFYAAVGIGQIPSAISLIPVIPSAFIACTLIFFSNVPIALAPELQSPSFREKILLKMHIKAAKKVAKEFENQG